MTGVNMGSSAPGISRRSVLSEALVVYGLSLLITILIVAVGQFVPFIQENAVALVAIVFLYLPTVALRRRGLEPADFGLTLRGARRGLGLGFLLALITLPLFWIGFHGWEVLVLDHSLHFRLDNYYAWPDQLRAEPDPLTEGLVLWRNQRNLVVTWSGQGEWTIQLETDGRMEYLSGPQPRVLRSEPRLAWEIETSQGRHHLAFLAVEGRQLTVSAQLDGHPPPRESIRLGNRVLEEDDPYPLVVERSLWWIPLWIIVQLLLVALPEEYFYRGYLQIRLNACYPARWHFGPFHLSLPILATSLLFALGHFLIGLDPQRLAVFFPSLVFGWLRDRSQGLAAPIVYHAACNLMVVFTMVHYWPS